MACHKRVSAASHAHKGLRLEKILTCVAGRHDADLRSSLVRRGAMNLSALSAAHCEGI